MCELRERIVDERIRGHLLAPLHASPVFGRGNKRSSNTALADAGVNKPAFDESNWTSGIAVVRVRAQSDFDEADEPGI